VAAQAALAAVAAAWQRLAPDYSCEPPHAGEKMFIGRSFRSNNVIAHGNHEGLMVGGGAGGLRRLQLGEAALHHAFDAFPQ
jgi:hypothetical protein